jgi:transposase
METTLIMSMKERVRLETFGRVKRGEMSVAKAAELLRLSLRQARRIWKRFKLYGDAGLVHRLRGRPGNALKGEVRDRALELCRRRYADFGSALAAEYLQKDGLILPRQTLWRWRRSAGDLAAVRRAVKHRTRRERRSGIGELVQMDGSTHDWFEGRRASCVLFVMIDDATSRLFCRFYESEDTASAFALFGGYIRKHGLPVGLYVDKDSIYRVNDSLAREHGRQRGQVPLTQFGRAMGQLSVEVICADSPQAKGRVERVNGTLQDRLVKALRLAGISTIQQANEFLQRQFLPEHNRRFAIAAAGRLDVHRKVPAGLVLPEILCVQEPRTVGRDWCVAYKQQVLQLDKRHEKLALAGRKITVLEMALGQLRLMYKGRRLKWHQAPARPLPQPPMRQLLSKPTAAPMPWRPPASHPWRTLFLKPAALQDASLRSASLRLAGLRKRLTG